MSLPLICHTKDEAIALLQQMAHDNGGWLSYAKYMRSNHSKPAPRTLARLLDCAPNWKAITQVVGIKSGLGDIYNGALTNNDIEHILRLPRQHLETFSVEQRRQICRFCLRRAHVEINGKPLRQDVYTTLAKGAKHYVSLHLILAVYDFNWIAALSDADLPTDNVPTRSGKMLSNGPDIADEQLAELPPVAFIDNAIAAEEFIGLHPARITENVSEFVGHDGRTYRRHETNIMLR